MLRRAAAFLLPVALGLLLALGAAPPPASAAPVSGLNGCGEVTPPTVGGWSTRKFFSYGRSTASGSTTAFDNGSLKASQLLLHEPCLLNSTTFAIPYTLTNSGWTENGDGSTVFFGGRGNAPSTAWTSASETNDVGVSRYVCMTPGGVVERNITNFWGQSNGGNSPQIFTTGAAQTNSANSCSQLLAVALYVSVAQYNSGGETVALYRYGVTWGSEKYLNDDIYVDPLPPGLEDFCNLNPDDLLCFGVNDPNPTGWEDTCGNVFNDFVYGVEYVAFNPVDPATWGPAAGWLAACLFVPLPDHGGFDRNGDVALAWANSPNADAGEQLVNLGNSFTYAPTCGALFRFPDQLGAAAVNTCTWTWAEPVRSVLAIGVLLAATFWFINFIVETSWSLMRNAPRSPLSEEGGSK